MMSKTHTRQKGGVWGGAHIQRGKHKEKELEGARGRR
jgi:hypothetical protein